MKPRHLTKSRIKLALECPTKLYYDGKPEYANQKIEDAFLLALADGGFQVGELAKRYFPGGYEVETLDYEEALADTNELLQKDQVTIYEAAVRFGQFFVRVDILRKNGNKIELIEVKAKSFDGSTENDFLNQKGSITAAWVPYLYDIAFQKHVAKSAFPQYTIFAFLMMADKNALCSTDGLNQKFKIYKDGKGRSCVAVSPELSARDLEEPILRRINVDNCCELIYQSVYTTGFQEVSFSRYLDFLAESYERDEKIVSTPSTVCANCEFKTTEKDKTDGLRNGFHECWQENLNWTENDFLEPTVIDIWNFRKKDKCISEGRIKMSDVLKDDIAPKCDASKGISSSERQWLQVQKVQNNDSTFWIDADNLRREMDSWVYPLHFIDFETSAVAIPFNKGRHPYEGIAFQFSHHVVYEDGRIEHKGQYLNAEPGVFPNYEFIRALKLELETDEGSIFRYAVHENTYLNMIYRQLAEDRVNISDRNELCQFIRTITQSVGSSPEKWVGKRNMIDMWEIVKRYYYDPYTNGSNSIKWVLPAILNCSQYLQQKYFKPIYGSAGGIPSLNYIDWTWIVFKNGQVVDPYKLLPKMFQDVSDKDFTLLSENDELRDGGAALTAYARMQFEEMSDYERQEITKALLKYCELDTMAMVMIYEAWRDMVSVEDKTV